MSAGDFNGAERGGVLIQHLAIHQPSAASGKFLAKHQQRGFRRIRGAGEHRLAAEQRALRHAVHSADEVILFPYFNRVRVAQLMKLVVGDNDIAGYPGAFMTIFSAAFDNLAEGVIERDAKG